MCMIILSGVNAGRDRAIHPPSSHRPSQREEGGERAMDPRVKPSGDDWESG
jgi:hypothetical protein